MNFKKIAVCHGPTCGVNGGPQILELLKKMFRRGDADISPRECCGRCANNNSIVVDDTHIISRLTPENIKKDFLDDPLSAIKRAQTEEQEIQKKLDTFLDSDELGETSHSRYTKRDTE